MNNASLALALAIVLAAPSGARCQATSPAAPGVPQSGTVTTTTTATPAQSAVPAPVAPPLTGALAADYVIGPSDSLEVSVFKEPTMSGTLPVRPDGMISLALVGDLQAAGLTPMQLSGVIVERLRKFINDPSVTVTVLGVNSKHIFLLGEVQKPGEMPLAPGINLLQAIASAGGLTQFANGKHIYILRTTGGKQLKIPFDYKKAIKNGNLQGVTLLAGDTIVVP